MQLERGILGNAIRAARMAEGMSQEELSEKVNISPIHLKHLEGEHRKPSVEVLFDIATTLNMSIDSFLYPTDSQKEALLHRLSLIMSQCSESELAIVEDLLLSLIHHRE